MNKRITLSDDQRLAAYRKCIHAANAGVTTAGLNFIASVLSGDIRGAAENWALMIVEGSKMPDTPDCFSLLTPDQQKMIAEEIKQRRREGNPTGSVSRGNQH